MYSLTQRGKKKGSTAIERAAFLLLELFRIDQAAVVLLAAAHLVG